MVKAELTEKSPLRSLEKAVQGGVGKGNLAVIASKAGVGKTACLVHIATDKLMQNQHVIHVSFANRVDHITDWYEDIFSEISKKRDLEDAMKVHDELIKNRVIMNFNQEGISIEKVLASVKSMMDKGLLNTDVIIVDGYNFTKGQPGDIHLFKTFAKECNIEIWFSDAYPVEGLFDPSSIPENLKDSLEDIAVIVTLSAEKDSMVLKLVKDHEQIISESLSLKLDPKTLLIAES